MAKATTLPSLTEGETNRLDKVRTDLAKINQEVEIGLSKLAAKFGPKMMGDVEGVVKQVMRLVDAFGTLAEKIHLLQGVSTVFEGWKEIFQGLTALIDAFSDPKKMEAIKTGFGDIANYLKQQVTSVIPTGGAIEGFLRGVAGMVLGPVPQPSAVGTPSTMAATPRVPEQSRAGGSTTSQNVTVNQNMSFADTNDKKGVADAAAAGVKQTYRQNPALLRHN